MTEKSIKYSGINRAVPQSLAPDGSCQEIINARPKKGCWRPIPNKSLHSFKPSAVFTYDSNPITFTQIYLHDIENGITPGQPNWIGYKLVPAVEAAPAYGQIYTINADNTCDLLLNNIDASIVPVSVVFLKRTMIITTGAGVLVFLFTPDKQYVQTASLPVPDVDLTTRASEYVQSEAYFSAEAVLGGFYAKLNELSGTSGKMFGSIMYITVYRLFDGSYILPCIPKYLNISNGGTLYRQNPGGGSSDDRIFDLRFYMKALSATVNNELYPSTIEDTKDLIESICVFATKSTTLQRIDETTLTNTMLEARPSPEELAATNFKTIFPTNPDFSKLAQTEGWYKIHEFSFEDVVGKTGRTTKDVDTTGFYQDYATRETLITDQFTHHTLNARSAYVYNDRLHILNIKTSLGSPYIIWPDNTDTFGQTDQTEGILSVWLKTSLGKAIRKSTISVPIYRIATQKSQLFDTDYSAAQAFLDAMEATPSSNANYIKGTGYISITIIDPYPTESFEVWYKEYESGDANSYYVIPSVVGYNDARAYKMQISVGGNLLFEETLTKNSLMNFATWNSTQFSADDTDTTKNFNVTKKLTSSITTAATIPAALELPFDTNRLQVSEIQNPLIFPTKNSYQIGTGDGITMCAGSEPLSTGQFGQFPLQVFTTKGVWALEIGSGDVLYTNVLPSSSEVVENAMNVISIGIGVVYSTVKGLFVLQGRENTEIGEINEGIPYSQITWNNWDILELIHLNTGENPNLHFTPGLFYSLSTVDFLEYLQESSIGYDQLNKELIVTNKEFSYSYIFSLEEKVWYKISRSYSLLINDYPKLIGIKDASIYSLSEEDETQHVEVLIITNAQSFELTDVYKKIERIIQRTAFTTNSGKVSGFYIFASDDLQTWHIISGKQKDGTNIKDLLCQRSHGSAKYYVLVFNGTVSCNTEIKQIEIIFKNKWNNRLR